MLFLLRFDLFLVDTKWLFFLPDDFTLRVKESSDTEEFE